MVEGRHLGREFQNKLSQSEPSRGIPEEAFHIMQDAVGVWRETVEVLDVKRILTCRKLAQ